MILNALDRLGYAKEIAIKSTCIKWREGVINALNELHH